jgi:protein tyrosine/serine phosphatase
MAPLYWAREEYLAAAFDHAGRLYGSFEAYADGALGVDETTRQRLCARLLEP